MTRSIFIALCVALVLSVASGTAIANSLTSAAFGSYPPGKVFDGSTGAADVLTWGTVTNVIYGPGTANTTVYAYGLVLNSAGTSITSVRSRTLNASSLANGTADTTMASKSGDDAVYSTAISSITSGPVVAVGLGNAAIAYTQADSGCNKVYVAIFTGGSATPSIKEISGFSCSHCTQAASTSGVGYANTVTGIFYENSTYYVTWTTQKFTETGTASTTTCTTSTTYPSAVVVSGAAATAEVNQQNFAYLQGISTGGTLKWTAPAALVTGTAGSAGVAPTIADSAYAPSCNQGNWTNSTNLICTVKTGATPNVINYLLVPTATGTPGTATAIATNVAASGSYPQTATTYSVAGIVHAQYQQGVLLNKFDTITASSGATATYANTLTLYNLTSGATATAGGVTLNVTNTYQSGAYGALGLSYGTGWGLVNTYSTAATTFASDLTPYYANGTVNGSKVSYFSGASATSQVFLDANGALWAGAYSLDDAGTPDTVTTGYLGRLVASTYSSTYGSILVTFFGLISLVIATLFVF